MRSLVVLTWHAYEDAIKMDRHTRMEELGMTDDHEKGGVALINIRLTNSPQAQRNALKQLSPTAIRAAALSSKLRHNRHKTSRFSYFAIKVKGSYTFSLHSTLTKHSHSDS